MQYQLITDSTDVQQSEPRGFKVCYPLLWQINAEVFNFLMTHQQGLLHCLLVMVASVFQNCSATRPLPQLYVAQEVTEASLLEDEHRKDQVSQE